MKYSYLFFWLVLSFSSINNVQLLAANAHPVDNAQPSTSDSILSEVSVLAEKVGELLSYGYTVNSIMAILAGDPSYSIVEKMVRNICEIVQHSNLKPGDIKKSICQTGEHTNLDLNRTNMGDRNIILLNNMRHKQAEEFYEYEDLKKKLKIIAAIISAIITLILLYKALQKFLDLFQGRNHDPNRAGDAGLPGINNIPEHIPVAYAEVRIQDAYVEQNNIVNQQQAPQQVIQQPNYHYVNAPAQINPFAGNENMLFYFKPMIDYALIERLSAELERYRNMEGV